MRVQEKDKRKGKINKVKVRIKMHARLNDLTL